MAPTPRKGASQPYQSELALNDLRNCFVNLPSPLVSVLVNANKPAQNVIVELTIRHIPPKDTQAKAEPKPVPRSIYLGWSGLQSKRKLVSGVGRDGLVNRNTGIVRDQEVPVVEIDRTFAKTLGLVDGQKVGVLLHPNPPEAYTVNIEPLTTSDWEILELHANFLETHLLSQIRAMPNPAFKSSSGLPAHSLTLHVSPTSTANILVTSLTPAPPATSPFAKISRDAEVIVAPKTRAKTVPSSSKSDPSIDGRSVASTSKTRSRRSEASRSPIFMRGIDRTLSADLFDNEEEIDRDVGLKVWVDWSILTTKEMRGVNWVCVSIVRPTALQAPADPQQQPQEQESVKPATKVVAQVCPWEEAPDSRHVAVSSSLCSVLDAPQLTGDMIRLEAAPSQLQRQVVQKLSILPFLTGSVKTKDGFQFGSKSKADREEAAMRILMAHGKSSKSRVFEGPLTDGMILPGFQDEASGASWPGGLLRFDPVSEVQREGSKSARAWFLGSDRKIVVKTVSEHEASSASKLVVEVQADAIKAPNTAEKWNLGEQLPDKLAPLVGMSSFTDQLISHIGHGSSVLLTGGRGCGKTSLAQLVARRLARSAFFHTTYYSCNVLNTDETRISSIKNIFYRVFGLAAWGTRNGGSALIVLDDLDAICPAETELQTNDNGRSRQVSEIIVSMTKQYCAMGYRVVLLATGKSKEDMNNVIIGGHVVREIVNIAAPDKETRRNILEQVVSSSDFRPNDAVGHEDGSVWMDGASSNADSDVTKSRDKHDPQQPEVNGFVVDPSIDFLDIAGKADGFMPGDLLLLGSRARSEALIRSLTDNPKPNANVSVTIKPEDFTAALRGFTPTSLRNVTLQTSSTTFSSIGGLRETRKTLLETLQYPTLYAPIFARCPLRLRSGLLLYGYPGCGKTLLASAVAGECGLNFISVKGPEILNKYIGASEKSVRDLFERAQAARPCVLFFDEFDSVAPKRGHDSTGVTDRVVNQLLTQMDGAEGLSGVYVLAATSRPDMIDPALLRPGRLDKSLLCDMPDYEDRLDILRALSQNLRISPSLLHDSSPRGQTLSEIARRTTGYSGADLQAVIYNAHLEAIHDVLGDRSTGSSTKDQGPKQARADKATSAASAASKNIPDFTYFRMGDSSNGSEQPQSAAQRAAERASIAAQLVSHRVAQQKARAARHAGLTGYEGAEGRGDEAKDKDSQEPTIEWSHIEKSLETTRPSISKEERRRLERIYREFVVGRNGEMPSGQGGSEIGGRSSLM